MSKTKNDRLRGNRSHGKGNTKNDRGSGCKGGKGRGGSFKHKFSKYYVTIGTKSRLKPKKELKTINLCDLEFISQDKTEINLKDLGYDKILGKGNISKKLIIKNAQATEKAKQKIEQAGGKIE
jgi:large subunit ribosomal protein L15